MSDIDTPQLRLVRAYRQMLRSAGTDMRRQRDLRHELPITTPAARAGASKGAPGDHSVPRPR